MGKSDDIRGSNLGGIIGRTFDTAEHGLTAQVKYDLAHPQNKTSGTPRGPFDSQYGDCSMTSCRIANPGAMGDKYAWEENGQYKANFGIPSANDLLKGEDAKDGLQVGDVMRYGTGTSTHFANVFFIDDDGVTQIFSRSGVSGVFETLRVDEPKIIQGYGPITGKFHP